MQRRLFGRLPDGTPDHLTGYACVPLLLRDAAAVAMSGVEEHTTLIADADAPPLAGIAYALTGEELAACDLYEGADYRRVLARLTSGRDVWVYVAA